MHVRGIIGAMVCIAIIIVYTRHPVSYPIAITFEVIMPTGSPVIELYKGVIWCKFMGVYL